MNLYSIVQNFKIKFIDEFNYNPFSEDIIIPSMFFIGTLVDIYNYNNLCS